MGIKFLRYGPLLYKTFLGHACYDWSFTDEVYNGLRTREIVPITDLCHFRVPDWIGNFKTRISVCRLLVMQGRLHTVTHGCN